MIMVNGMIMGYFQPTNAIWNSLFDLTSQIGGSLQSHSCGEPFRAVQVLSMSGLQKKTGTRSFI